jgi:hypothetical protein
MRAARVAECARMGVAEGRGAPLASVRWECLCSERGSEWSGLDPDYWEAAVAGMCSFAS